MNDVRRSLRRLVAAAVALVAFLPVGAAAATLTMSEFLALQPKWDALAASGETLRVEGRIASASNRLIRLRNCPLDFRPVEETLPEINRNAVTVEVAGRLGRRNRELVFLVSEMIEPPSDGKVYELKESSLDVTDPADWNALADWAAQRGRFYEDRFLLERAASARRRGLELERTAATGKAEALAALAAKAETYKLDEFRRQVTHEALRARWNVLRRDGKADLDPLLAAITESLPGAATPLEKWPADLAAAYAADPVAVFDAATANARPHVERLFFAEVQQAAIERLAAPQGANGEFLADELAAALPERPDLARDQREREMTYRLERIRSATRSEALTLARRLESRGRPDEARQALSDWLTARKEAARQDSPAELARVAEDYADLLDDKPAAAALLVELLEQAPESTDIREKLRQLGYVNVDGAWLTKTEAATRPVNPVVAAMREGRVAVDMSPGQVRKTLGAPDRIARSAGTAQVHEVWTYGKAGQGGLAVHFLRYVARGPADARVVGVTTLAR